MTASLNLMRSGARNQQKLARISDVHGLIVAVQQPTEQLR